MGTDAVEEIADQQGFFHWELEFAQVFSDGGFDLEMGNPPWIRPRWQEDIVLAEREPWFALDKPPAEEWRARKADLLEEPEVRRYFLGELATNAGTLEIQGSAVTYPPRWHPTRPLPRLHVPRLANLGPHGSAGLLPDSHFGGTREGPLRAAAYLHLCFHAHFSNRRGVFPDIHANTEFGVHIYGPRRPTHFTHMSWLFDPVTLTESLDHDGSGEKPGIKHDGRSARSEVAIKGA